MNHSSSHDRILVVDDVQLNLDLIKEILSGNGYMVATAINGRSALAKAKAHKFDLILLDIVLPDIDGFDVCATLKANPQTKEIPVIFLTAKKESDAITKGFHAGAVDYIPKPFSREELLARVDLHLTLRKTQDELIRSKDLALASEKAKAAFLAGISHEIRTPMNGIIGMTDILKRTCLSKQQLEYVEIIGISGENLLSIINDVLDFSKIEAGQVTSERINFRLSDEVSEVIKILRYKAEQKGLELSFHLAEGIPEFLIGDPLRLKQVLINLSNNAIKFTDEGFVSISCELLEENKKIARLKFSVSDSGIGISEENQGKLFRAFSQAETSTTRKFGGTGLGLVISKNLVELMKGKIGVFSEEGKGSTFFFDAEFEISSKQPQAEEPEAPVTIENPTRGLRILLAEDNVINQKVAILNLEKMGHQVITVVNGVEAVEKFISESPDAILMDIQMPQMDGVAATGRIRQIEQESGVKKGVPIIAMTANNSKTDIDHLLSSGMDGYLSKPFTMADLVLIMNQIFKHIEFEKN